MAAITNCHKLAALEQQNFIISHFCEAQIGVIGWKNPSVGQAVLLLEALGEDLVLVSFSSGGCLTP